jgi:putative oxidoreductase
MKIIDGLTRFNSMLGRWLDQLQPLLLLFTRFYVGWQFTKSGWLKLSSWDTTLGLFRDEYRVPLLPPDIAAVAGTAGELLFPVLLYAGLYARIGALGLFAVNAMAVISYRHVLLAEGFEAALGDHVLWGFMALALIVVGPGRIALDTLLQRRVASGAR